MEPLLMSNEFMELDDSALSSLLDPTLSSSLDVEDDRLLGALGPSVEEEIHSMGDFDVHHEHRDAFGTDGGDLFGNGFLSNLDFSSNTLQLDSLLAQQREDDNYMIRPNYGAPLMAPSVPPAKAEAKPKRKYVKRKSEDLSTGNNNMLGVGAKQKKGLFQKYASTGDVRMSSLVNNQFTAGNNNKVRAKPTMTKYRSSPAVPIQANSYLSTPKASLTVVSAPASTPKAKSTGSDDKSSALPKQTSSFRGVSCCGKDRKWQARIRDANRVRYLGRFGTEVEAALVYDEAARALKGERAPTNFIKLDAQTKDDLKAAFVHNGLSVPDHMMHLVVRVKVKAPPQKVTIPKVNASRFQFPDSPVAKLNKTSTPLISPTSQSTKVIAQPQKSAQFANARMQHTALDNQKRSVTQNAVTAAMQSIAAGPELSNHLPASAQQTLLV